MDESFLVAKCAISNNRPPTSKVKSTNYNKNERRSMNEFSTTSSRYRNSSSSSPSSTTQEYHMPQNSLHFDDVSKMSSSEFGNSSEDSDNGKIFESQKRDFSSGISILRAKNNDDDELVRYLENKNNKPMESVRNKFVKAGSVNKEGWFLNPTNLKSVCRRRTPYNNNNNEIDHLNHQSIDSSHLHNDQEELINDDSCIIQDNKIRRGHIRKQQTPSSYEEHNEPERADSRRHNNSIKYKYNNNTNTNNNNKHIDYSRMEYFIDNDIHNFKTAQVEAIQANAYSQSAMISPYEEKLFALRREKLKLEEAFLLKTKCEQELERTRFPRPKWYELKTKQFTVEMTKHNDFMRHSQSSGEVDYKELMDYRVGLFEKSKEYSDFSSSSPSMSTTSTIANLERYL